MKNIHILLLLIVCLLPCRAQRIEQNNINTSGYCSDEFSYSFGTSLIQTGVADESIVKTGMHFADDNFVLIEDSFNVYEVGDIPDQYIWLGNSAKFKVICDSLGKDAKIHASAARTPFGVLDFDSSTNVFNYIPSSEDRLALPITFTAVKKGQQVKQSIQLVFNPNLPSEYVIFDMEKGTVPDEDSQDFVAITTHLNSNDSTLEYFNNAMRLTRKVVISGKNLVFKRGHQSTLENYSGDKTITDLYLFAEQITVAMQLELPQTNVHIFAEKIIFEDSANEMARIITTPPSIGVLPEPPDDNDIVGNNGKNGMKGGDIELRILDIQSDVKKRFITCGAHGQAAGLGENGARSDKPIPGGKPGNGGDAGDLISTIDLGCYADMTGGSAGTKAPPTHNDVGAVAYGENAGKMRGEDGVFVEIQDKNSFLHPFGLRMIMKHAKNAYVNYGMHYTANVMTKYRDYILEYSKDVENWSKVDPMTQSELIELKEEMNLYLFRIGSNFDYFGNPVGWVPMLSFEVNKAAFESEVESAIDVLYLSYWIQNSYDNLALQVAAMKESRDKQIKNLKALKAFYNTNVELVPGLRTERDEIQYQIEDIQERILQKEKQLLHKAKKNVKERHKMATIKKVAKVASSMCMVVPGMQGVGFALNVASNVDFEDPLSIESLVDVGIGAFDYVSQWEAEADNVSSIINGIDLDITSLESIGETVGKLSDAAEEANLNLDDFKSIANSIKVSDAEIAQEFERLKAQCVEYQELLVEEQALLERKKIFVQRIIETISTVTAAANEILVSLLGIDAITQSIQTEDFMLDHRAMVYLNEMEQRAKDRLLKFHYFMAKAYEYRLLKSYEEQLDLSNLFERFGAIAEASSGHTLSKEDFESLKAIYEEQVSTITDNILTEYNTNAPEVRSSMPYRLKKSQIETFNLTGKLTLNLYDEGFFQSNEENVRITSLKVKSVEMEGKGIGSDYSWAYSDVLIYHSGVSKLMKKGQTYYFNHYNMDNKNPLVWGVKYDLNDGLKDHLKPSPASQSLLSSILSGIHKYSEDNVLLYSRPSAWANLLLEKTDNIQGGGKFEVKNLVLEIDYDYQIVPKDRVNMFVESSYENGERNSPNVIIDRVDNYDRKDGQGSFSRNFFRNQTAKVKLETEEEYGESKFIHWEDQNGNILSENPSVNISLANNIKLKSVYSNLSQDTITSNDEKPTSEESMIEFIKCYPNPVKDELTVKLIDPSIALLEVVNMQGVVLNKVEVFSKDYSSIDFSSLPKGVYFINAISVQNQKVHTVKFIK